MEQAAQLVVFVVAQQRFAVWLRHVVGVHAAAQTTTLPGAPPGVLGILDLHGTVIPILDLRRGTAGARPPLRLDDQFLIVQTGTRTIGLLVNQTLGLADGPAGLDALSAQAALQGHAGERFEGAVTLDDGLVLIHDIEGFLSASAAQALDRALQQRGAVDAPEALAASAGSPP